MHLKYTKMEVISIESTIVEPVCFTDLIEAFDSLDRETLQAESEKSISRCEKRNHEGSFSLSDPFVLP